MENNTWFWCLINTSLIILSVAYFSITRDLGRVAYDRCEELEKELAIQKERCEYLSSFIMRRDTIVINFNYNEKKAVAPKKK
jgi:hypothetical protein